MDEVKRKEVWKSLEIYFSKIAILESEIEDIFMNQDHDISFSKNDMNLSRKEFLKFIELFHAAFCPIGGAKIFVMNAMGRPDFKESWRAMQKILDEATLEAFVLIYQCYLNPKIEVEKKMRQRIDPLLQYLQRFKAKGFKIMDIIPLFSKLYRMANALMKYGNISDDLVDLLREIHASYNKNDLKNFRNADLVLNLTKNLDMIFLHKPHISYRHRMKVEKCVRETEKELMESISHAASDLSHNDSNTLNTVSRSMIALQYLMVHGTEDDASVIEDLSLKLEKRLEAFSSYLNDINSLFDEGSYLDWESRMQLMKLRDIFSGDLCPDFIVDSREYIQKIDSALAKIDASYISLQESIVAIEQQECRNTVYGCIYDISESFKFSFPSNISLMKKCNRKLVDADPDKEDLEKMVLIVNSIFCYMMSLNEAQLWNKFVSFRSVSKISTFLDTKINFEHFNIVAAPLLPFLPRPEDGSKPIVTYRDLANCIRDLRTSDPGSYDDFCNAVINAMTSIGFCSRNEIEFAEDEKQSLMQLFTIATIYIDITKGTFLRQKFSYLRLSYDLTRIFDDLSLKDHQKMCFLQWLKNFVRDMFLTMKKRSKGPVYKYRLLFYLSFQAVCNVVECWQLILGGI